MTQIGPDFVLASRGNDWPIEDFDGGGPRQAKVLRFVPNNESRNLGFAVVQITPPMRDNDGVMHDVIAVQDAWLGRGLQDILEVSKKTAAEDIPEHMQAVRVRALFMAEGVNSESGDVEWSLSDLKDGEAYVAGAPLPPGPRTIQVGFIDLIQRYARQNGHTDPSPGEIFDGQRIDYAVEEFRILYPRQLLERSLIPRLESIEGWHW